MFLHTARYNHTNIVAFFHALTWLSRLTRLTRLLFCPSFWTITFLLTSPVQLRHASDCLLTCRIVIAACSPIFWLIANGCNSDVGILVICLLIIYKCRVLECQLDTMICFIIIIIMICFIIIIIP